MLECEAKTFCFADDITLISDDQDMTELTFKANKIIFDINKWFIVNSLAINFYKKFAFLFQSLMLK